jgi:ubiquinone/menaquinone biosynthesis C-methylase UbiE
MNKTVKQPSIQDYYATRESRWGYQLFLSNTRHFGYYKSPSSWPFPISKALRAMEQKLADTLNLSAGAKVLDAGAGVADVASFMAMRGLTVEAIDLVDRHITLAKRNVAARKLTDSVSITKMNYQELDFGDKYFDGVYTMETFVHATNPDKALSEFYRVLKPGGKIALFEYDRAADNDMPQAARKAFEQVNKYASMPTFQRFTYGVPEQLLTDAGFTDIVVEDIFPHILPMLRLFAIAAFVPYEIIKLLHLEHRFVNAMSAVEYYHYRSYMRYVVISAKK